jgi:hypothetical protein
MPVARRIFLVIALGVLSGCAQVAPWERGNLARPEMGLSPVPDRAWLEQHVYTSKEAAQGGHGSGGGGCGCN